MCIFQLFLLIFNLNYKYIIHIILSLYTYRVESTKASFRKTSGQVDLNGSRKKKVASILPPICKAFGATFMFGAFLKLLQDIMTFISPQILK